MKKEKRYKKIAIIGAGPSGLAAAESLREIGYQHITVFEKKNRAGGMAYSKIYEDEYGKKVTYDLGSVQPVGSKRIFKMIKENNLHLGKSFVKGGILKIRIYCIRQKRYIVDFLKHPMTGLRFNKFPLLFLDCIKLLYWIIKYNRLGKPGFDNAGDCKLLSQPFQDWLRERKFKILDRILNLLWSNYLNGGVFEKKGDHSILYGLKALCCEVLNPPMRYMVGNVMQITEGYQALWNTISKKHNIFFNSKITKISRSDKVTITTLEDQYVFDYLIVACPPADLMDVMDITPKEKEIFSKIHYSPVWRAR